MWRTSSPTPPSRKLLPVMCCSPMELEFQLTSVIWAGGLKPSSLSNNVGVKLGHGGRIDVQPDFSVKGFGNVYALGDFANVTGPDGKTLPSWLLWHNRRAGTVRKTSWT